MKKKEVKITFYSLVAIFVLILSYFLIPFSDAVKRPLFLYMAILSFVFLVGGIVLIVMTKKDKKIKGRLRSFLLLTGVAPSVFFGSVILHNLFYGFGILSQDIWGLGYFFDFLHVLFFLIAIVGSPLMFIGGAAGVIWFMCKKKFR